MTDGAVSGQETMTRGGRRRDLEAEGPERRCIATGESGPTERLIRFVRDPEGRAVPDLAERLPGRGVWLTAERALAEKAAAKRLFSRAFKAETKAPEGLADLLERLLVERLVAQIAMARKAGQAVTGFEKTRFALDTGRMGVLLTASDAAADGRAKLVRLAGDLPRIELLSSGELGLAFGREFAIHAALEAGAIADRAMRETRRLAGLRQEAAPDTGGDPGVADPPSGGA